MDFFDVVSNRHSIRAFHEKEVEPGELQRVLETANSAPSAGDLQAYEVVLVKDPKRKAALARAAFGQDFIATAPVVLVFCAAPRRSAAKYGRRGTDLY